MKSVVKRVSDYCKEFFLKCVPVESQPSETELFTLMQHYATLKRDKTYKKISWFAKIQ